MRHTLIRISVAITLLALFLLNALGWIKLPLLPRFEAIAYDIRMNLTLPEQPFDGIAIIDIDEKSLAEEGRFPWGRDRLALLLDKLFERHQVAAVGFDIVFAEKDESSGLSVLRDLANGQLRNVQPYQQALERLAPRLERDTLFAASMQNRPVVLGYYFTTSADGIQRRVGQLPEPIAPALPFDQMGVYLNQASGYGANLPALQQAAISGGHFNPSIDIDGVVRKVPMLIRHADQVYQPLSLALLRAALGDPPVEFVIPQTAGQEYAALEGLAIGDMLIPVDEHGQALVPYRGPQGSFPYVSATDVMHDRIAPDQLAGKIILVGTTAPGLKDLRVTPVGSVYAGVEIHANMIAGILEQNIKHTPKYAIAIELLTLLFAGLLLTLLLPRLSPLLSTLLTLLVLATIVAGNMWAWQHYNLVLPIAASLSLVLLIYVFDVAYGYFVETRNKHLISDLFGQYIPPQLVDEMSQHPEQVSMNSDSREMTVLFSDIRDFTSISEKLSPQELTDILNTYLTAMTEVIHQYRGTIDKYMGDAIMAFWGAPLKDEQHAQHAVEAGLAMLERLHQLQAEFRQRGWPELRIGIGVNTGIMSVGNMGSQFRRAYTAMGDAVNLGSRLEGLTKQYGVAMIVSENTAAATQDIRYCELDRVSVKGKQEPVRILEPQAKNGSELPQRTEEEIHIFEEALMHYRNQHWQLAEERLQTLLHTRPEQRLYRTLLDRIAEFRQQPPPADWNGVYEFHTK